MRILVLSDNHYINLNFDYSKYDYVIHCGDYGNEYANLTNNKAYFVKGNCDIRGTKEKNFTIDNKVIYITHGDLYNVKNNLNTIIYKAMSLGANVCCFGHTHIPNVFVIDNILYLNPGSYKDGYYAEITDENVVIYCNNKEYKNIEYRW